MKTVRRFGVALFTFLLGVAISPIQFYAQAMGRGKLIDGGGWFSVTSYRSSYFVNLLFVNTLYVSPEKANEVFAAHLNEAVHVFEVGPKINRHGAVVGRRAMALFFSPECSCYYTEIFWTEGRMLAYIVSTSALHVKEFEKQQR